MGGRNFQGNHLFIPSTVAAWWAGLLKILFVLQGELIFRPKMVHIWNLLSEEEMESDANTFEKYL